MLNLKTIVFTGLSAVAIIPVTAHADPVRGALCSSSLTSIANPSTDRFLCPDLDKATLTIPAIYQKGWKVVQVIVPNTQNTIYNTIGLIVEEQKHE